uniref:CSON009030 protein n=1 Tax=Culicoides sonorensis TaxID=179676 RepID=A0A336LK36_CULSO
MTEYIALVNRLSTGFELLQKDVTFVFCSKKSVKRQKCANNLKTIKNEIKANKLVLSFASPVFNAMFNGPLKESSNRIYITDISKTAFQKLINVVHLKDVTFTSIEDALSAYKAGDKYDIPDLCNKINNYLNKRTTADNVCQIHEHSKIYDISELRETCRRIFIQDTEKVLKSKSFLNSSIDTLNYIYTLPGLEIESEEILCDGLQRFVVHNQLNLKDVRRYLSPCLNSIRFLTLSVEKIQKYDKILNYNDRQLLISTLSGKPTESSKSLRQFNTSRKQRYVKQVPEIPICLTNPTYNDDTSNKHLYTFYF